MNPIHFLYGPFQGRTVQGLRNENVPQVESGHLPETGATAGGGNFPSVDSRPPGHHEEQSCVRTVEARISGSRAIVISQFTPGGDLRFRKQEVPLPRENDDTDSRADLSDAAIREWCGKSGVVCPPGPLLVVPAEDDAGMDNTQGNGSPLHLPRRQEASIVVGKRSASPTKSNHRTGDKRNRLGSRSSPPRSPATVAADSTHSPKSCVSRSDIGRRSSPRLLRRVEPHDSTTGRRSSVGRLIEGGLGSDGKTEEDHRRVQPRTGTELTPRSSAENLCFLAHKEFSWGNGRHSNSFYNVASLSVMARLDAGPLDHSETSKLAREYFAVLQKMLEGLDEITDRKLQRMYHDLRDTILGRRFSPDGEQGRGKLVFRPADVVLAVGDSGKKGDGWTNDENRERHRTLDSFGLLEGINLHDCSKEGHGLVSPKMNARFGPPPELISLRRKESDSRSVASLAGPNGISDVVVYNELEYDPTDADDEYGNYNIRFFRAETPCPQCLLEAHENSAPAEVNSTRWSRIFKRRWGGARGGARECFFMLVGVPDRHRTDPMPHEMNIFGSAYVLRAVIYETGGGHHFVCQASLRGGWYKYNDMAEDGKLLHGPSFDTEWHAGSEYMLMYVGADVVARRRPSITMEQQSSLETLQETPPGGTGPPVKEPSPPTTANTNQARAYTPIDEADGGTSDDGVVTGVAREGGVPPPPLLTTAETKARRLGESQTLLTDAVYGARYGSKDDCECQRDPRLVVVRNSSNNCFASVTLLMLASLACELGGRWPKAEDVSPHAQKFFGLVQQLKERLDDLKRPGASPSSCPETFKEPLAEAVDSLLCAKDDRNMPYEGGGTDCGDPTSIITRLAEPLQGATTQQCQTTRRALGLAQPWRVFGCHHHPDDSAVEGPQSMSGVCRTVKILSLPARPTRHTVQQAIDAQNKAMEDGQKPPDLLTGRCPLCAAGSMESTQWVQVARDFQAPGPASFFVEIKPATNVKTSRFSAAPSIGVRAYGEPYVLNTVIYKSLGHFTCQTRLGGKCFWTFDDLDQKGEVIPEHQFNPSYAGGGAPHLLLYVRQQLVTEDKSAFLEREASLSEYSQLQGELVSWSEPEQHGIFYRQRMALASERALIGETTPDENAAREQQRKAQIQVIRTLTAAFIDQGYASRDETLHSNKPSTLAKYWIDVVFGDWADNQTVAKAASERGFPGQMVRDAIDDSSGVEWTTEATENFARWSRGKCFP